RSYNIAARMGHWSATHWKTAVFGWLAFVIAAAAIGAVVGQKTTAMQSPDVGQAKKADNILKQAGFPQADPLTEIVVIQSPRLTVTDPPFRSAITDVLQAVRPVTTIDNIRSPLDPANAGQLSADRHTALVEWQMRGDEKTAQRNVAALTRATDAVAKAHPD